MPGLSNITAYAKGGNIDAQIDAAVNGTPAKEEAPKAEVHEVAASAPKKHMYQKVDEAVQHGAEVIFKGAEKVFGPASHWPTLGSVEDAAKTSHSASVASVDNSGLSTVREGLGADAAKISDAELTKSLGAEVVAQIGKEGFPHQEVAGIQKEFASLDMDKVAALQSYVEACNSAPGEQLHLSDHKGETVAVLNTDKILEAAGLSRTEVAQAQETQQQRDTPRTQQAAPAADTGMSMA